MILGDDEPVYQPRLPTVRNRQAEDFDHAIERAEAEAAAYTEGLDAMYLGLAQAYAFDGEPGDGLEVFSLMRVSDLGNDDYLTRFFDTGSERQQGM